MRGSVRRGVGKGAGSAEGPGRLGALGRAARGDALVLIGELAAPTGARAAALAVAGTSRQAALRTPAARDAEGRAALQRFAIASIIGGSDAPVNAELPDIALSS